MLAYLWDSDCHLIATLRGAAADSNRNNQSLEYVTDAIRLRRAYPATTSIGRNDEGIWSQHLKLTHTASIAETGSTHSPSKPHLEVLGQVHTLPGTA